MNKEIKFSNLIGLMPSITLWGEGAQHLRNNYKAYNIIKLENNYKHTSVKGGII